MNTTLPFSESAERNQKPIAQVLKDFITKQDRNIFEIGSGTGQHAAYLGSCFSHLDWQTSDVKSNHSTIQAYIDRANLNNLLSPIEFEVGKTPWPRKRFDIVYTANTLHIMSWKNVKTTLKSVNKIMNEGGQFFIYGPFKFDGEFTSESNEKFDLILKENDPQRGIRNFEDIKTNLEKNNLMFTNKIEMPANNMILVFTKITKQEDKK